MTSRKVENKEGREEGGRESRQNSNKGAGKIGKLGN
jgi:hypothetical protein